MRTVQLVRLIAVAAASLLLWGCAGGPQTRPARDAAPSAPDLSRELASLTRDQSEAWKVLNATSKRLDELEKRMGTAESLSKENARLLKELTAKVEEVNSRLVAREMPEAPKEPVTEEAAPPTKAEAISLRRLYTAAYEAFKRQDYQNAAKMFGEFVESFPQSRLADNAQFYIGESLFRMNDLPGALKAYEKVEVNFSSGNRVPDALYEKGVVYLQMGDVSSAIVELKRTAMSFPRDPAAQRAKDKLIELGLSPQP